LIKLPETGVQIGMQCVEDQLIFATMKSPYVPRQVGYAALDEITDALNSEASDAIRLLPSEPVRAIQALRALLIRTNSVSPSAPDTVPFLASMIAGEIDKETRYEVVMLLAEISFGVADAQDDGMTITAAQSADADRLRQAFTSCTEQLRLAAKTDLMRLSTISGAILELAKTQDFHNYQSMIALIELGG
jgi:hypothetical protein